MKMEGIKPLICIYNYVQYKCRTHDSMKIEGIKPRSPYNIGPAVRLHCSLRIAAILLGRGVNGIRLSMHWAAVLFAYCGHRIITFHAAGSNCGGESEGSI